MKATPQTTTTDPWLTIEEVAAELRLERRSLYDWRVRKVGPPAVKVGRRLLYRRSELERWLAAQST